MNMDVWADLDCRGVQNDDNDATAEFSYTYLLINTSNFIYETNFEITNQKAAALNIFIQ